MPIFQLTLCYEGTRYDGWQKQGNTSKTLQQRVEAALSEALSQPVAVAGSGRTDAGVHARAQVASFRAEKQNPGTLLLIGFPVVEHSGFEPLTSTMRMSRANEPILLSPQGK